MVVCDFCSSPEVHWSYPARDFVVEPLSTRLRQEGLPGAGSAGGWAACDPCHRLIQRSDRVGLATRATRRFARTRGITDGGTISAVLDAIRAAHDQFWTNREGAPEAVTVSLAPVTEE